MVMSTRPLLHRVRALVDGSRFADAAALLTAEAEAGDASALGELAQWSISGDIIPRDLAQARSLLARAATAGDDESGLLNAAFLASGTGGTPDWPGALGVLSALAPRNERASRQIEMLSAMDLDKDGFPARLPAPEPLSIHPDVGLCRGFLSPAEAEYLAAIADPFLQPSLVVDERTGQTIPHPVRRSDGAMFGVRLEDAVVAAINRRIAALTDTGYDQGEPLQLLRYRRGNEYRAHVDTLPGEPNQRLFTVIVYLTEGYEGGETVFPRTGLRVKGRLGDALVFRNLTLGDQPDPLTQHAGLPVASGEKMIATRWIRIDRFSYPPPRPLLPNGA
jgi:prolyl 4-hydroxylase